MEDGVNLMHRESLFDFYDKEVDGLLVTLQNIDGIVAFTNKDFIFLGGEEFGEFPITDCGAAELEGSIEEGNVLRIKITDDLGTDFYSLKDLLYLL